MAEKKVEHTNNNAGFGSNFQPDVIVSNSHQRPGPDGSPALIPSRSQGFLICANLSDTGELFAPVRTLTFSDIDQSSNTDDNYVNTMSLVSTPNRKEIRPATYDYSSMQSGQFRTVENNENFGNGGNSDNDPDNIEDGNGAMGENSVSPEFRQLIGEADSDGTGTFYPSAHGPNKEFMVRSNAYNVDTNADVFSPLGSSGYRFLDRSKESITPPLHSSGTNSPYTNSHHRSHVPYQNQEDPEEMEFAMSLTNNISSLQSFQKEVLIGGHGQVGHILLSKERFFSRNYPGQNAFKPIKTQTQSNTHTNIPNNLDEYLGKDYNGQMLPIDIGYDNSYEQHKRHDRQGDGSDNEVEMMQQAKNGQQYRSESPKAFENRYLQRTQVSVKLPQATYDTLSQNSPTDDKYCTNQYEHTTAVDVPRQKHPSQTSPGKVMDLLKNQVSNLQNVEISEELIVGESRDFEQVNGLTLASYNDKLDGVIMKSNDVATINETDIHVNSSNSMQENINNNGQEMAVVQNAPCMSQNFTSTNVSQNQVSKPVITSHSQSSHIQSQVPVSSRLLQETVSQRNKTTQKFVSSAPVATKPVAAHKEFRKLHDILPKSASVACSGARKPGPECEKSNKFKASDKLTVTSKSTSKESLENVQKSKKNDQSRNAKGDSVSQSRNGGQFMNHSTSSGQQAHEFQLASHRDQELGRGDALNDSMAEDDNDHGRVITQVETTSPVPIETVSLVSVEMPAHDFSCSQNAVHNAPVVSVDIRGMEEVRHQLQNMMKMSHGLMSTQDRSQYEHSDIVAGFNMGFGDQVNVDMSRNIFKKHSDDEVLELFPSFTSKYFMDSGNMSRTDTSVHSENQKLRDMLEKERYRRKHCEQYIQQLNAKLLETQQQVAVAVSTDQRKDIMIEQLDKQLAKVMEGWKKRDQEKDNLVVELRREKDEIQHRMPQQQEMMRQLEHEMSECVEALRQEKEKSLQSQDEMKDKILEAERASKHSQGLLDGEKEKVELLQQECDSLREARENLDKKLDLMQKCLHREQDEWFQREQDLLQKIEYVSEKNNKILQLERAKNEEQGKLAEEIMEQYQTADTLVKKLELDLDATMREKESVKVEMGIMEAKFENAQRILEADMQSTMEKQISDQVKELQKHHEKTQNEIGEKHRQQILELSQRHGTEIGKQLSMFREEMHKKEDEFRKQIQEMETQLMDYRNENAELKRSKLKLESTRLEILTKLQYAMQSQWNETLSLLASTPQRKTRSHTPCAGQDEGSGTTIGEVTPSVNFSFYSSSTKPQENMPLTQPKNKGSPPGNPGTSSRYLTNDISLPSQQNIEGSPFRSTTNQISPIQRHDMVSMYSPDHGSVLSHSTERDLIEADDVDIENAAMLHLRQIQEYKNSFTHTPEWISSINKESSASSSYGFSQSTFNGQNLPQRSPQSDTNSHQASTLILPNQNDQLWTTQGLPSPPVLAALLSTHSHSIQQQHLIARPPSLNPSQQLHLIVRPPSLNSLQPQHLIAHPSSLKSSQLQNFIACPPSLNQPQQPHLVAHTSSSINSSMTTQPHLISFSEQLQDQFQSSASKPQDGTKNIFKCQATPSFANSCVSPMTERVFHEIELPASSLSPTDRSILNADSSLLHHNNDDSLLLDSAPGMLMAVPMGPPQQGNDPYSQNGAHFVISGGQNFSPPTKQNRISENNSMEEENSPSSRLNEDYSHLQDKFEQHEPHQNELQHYIQLLFKKTADEMASHVVNDDSVVSYDNEELDLNDTAQASQLQRELVKIQQLRQRQEATSKSQQQICGMGEQLPQKPHGLLKIPNQNKILTPEQLEEATKLLNQVKGQPQSNNNPQITELLELLKHANIGNQSEHKTDTGHSVRFNHHGDKLNFPVGIKKNMQFTLAKGVANLKSVTDSGKTDKTASSNTQSKKMERKIAGATPKVEVKGAAVAIKADPKGPKPAAWK